MANKALDHRKFLKNSDPEPTPAQRAAFDAIVTREVNALRRSNRDEVNTAINDLLNNPVTKAQVGDQLIRQLPDEIERKLEHL